VRERSGRRTEKERGVGERDGLMGRDGQIWTEMDGQT